MEHQSRVHYDMSFRMLRYIVMVLTDYEAGVSAKRDYKDRVHLSDILGEYIPSFEYIVVPLNKYSNNEIAEKNDELSLIMLINKLKSSEEFKNLKELPTEYLKNLEENTPEYLLKLISKIISVLLYRLNVPRKEVEVFTDQIVRREFSMLFDSFEAYDVQAVRKESKLETMKENIISLLEDYGTVSDDAKKIIFEEENLDTLKIWHKLAAHAESIADFKEKAGI